MEKYIFANADISDESVYKANAMKESHSHDYYEIYYFLGDEMTFFLDNMPLNLYTHDIVLINKHIFHRTFYNSKKKNNRRVNISFNSGFLHRYLDLKTIDKIMLLFDTPLMINNKRTGEDLGKFILPICSNYGEPDEYSQLNVYHGICMLLVELLRGADNFKKAPSIEELPREQNRISQIVRYINMNYDENVTLSSLARQFFVNKHYLSHSFKDTTGVGITDFINRKRASEAAFLLENTNMALTEISGMVGFNSQSYFIRTFKAYYNIPPNEYRAAKKNLKEYCDYISDINVRKYDKVNDIGGFRQKRG